MATHKKWQMPFKIHLNLFPLIVWHKLLKWHFHLELKLYLHLYLSCGTCP